MNSSSIDWDQRHTFWVRTAGVFIAWIRIQGFGVLMVRAPSSRLVLRRADLSGPRRHQRAGLKLLGHFLCACYGLGLKLGPWVKGLRERKRAFRV